jgi:hypothetical protein
MSFSQDTFEFLAGKTKEALQGSTNNWNSFVNINPENSLAAISFSDRDSAYYFLVDSSFSIKSNYSIPKSSIINNYYNGTFNIVLQKQSGNVFTNFLQKPNLSIVYIEEENFDLDTSIFKQFLDFSGREKFITGFNKRDHSYLLTLIRGTNKLRLYEDDNTTPKEVTVPVPEFATDINLENALKDILVVSSNTEIDLNTAKRKVKLYTDNSSKIYITLDESYKYTLLLTIDLEQNTSKSDIFFKTNYYCNQVDRPEIIQHNSFLFKDRLVQAVLCPQHFLLQIKNIEKDSALISFHAQRDSAISFASSGIIKSDENTITRRSLFGTRKENTTTAKKDLTSKDFFKAVNMHDFSFLIAESQGYVVVKIGESHSLFRTTGGSMDYMGGPPGSPGSMPVYHPGHTSRADQIETYFKTVMKSLDTTEILDEDIDTKFDKIDDFEFDIKDDSAAGTAFDFNNKTYYFYWSKSMEKFLIATL